MGNVSLLKISIGGIVNYYVLENFLPTNTLFFFFKDFIYLFLEREGRKDKERERDINVWLMFICPLLWTWPAPQACALTRNQTGDPLVHSPHSIH